MAKSILNRMKIYETWDRKYKKPASLKRDWQVFLCFKATITHFLSVYMSENYSCILSESSRTAPGTL